jgi:hypothetical protein
MWLVTLAPDMYILSINSLAKVFEATTMIGAEVKMPLITYILLHRGGESIATLLDTIQW